MGKTPELNLEFIEGALERHRRYSAMGNEVLYALCRDHPKHDTEGAIIAKFWLIGRSYAAAIERRRNKGRSRNSDFYKDELVPLILKSKIDSWFDVVKADGANSSFTNVKVHKQLVDLLSKITNSDKRSLASKYLHFHFSDRFYIYDSRASAGLKKIMRSMKMGHRAKYTNGDPKYSRFYDRCELLRNKLEERFGRRLTRRDLDCILVRYYEASRQPQAHTK